MEGNVKGTFRAPQNIENVKVYQNIAKESIMDAHLKCKDVSEVKIAKRQHTEKVMKDNKSFADTFRLQYVNRKHQAQVCYYVLLYFLTVRCPIITRKHKSGIYYRGLHSRFLFTRVICEFDGRQGRTRELQSSRTSILHVSLRGDV